MAWLSVNPDDPLQSALLSGSFGVFQAVASAKGSTAELWSALRVNAAEWQARAQGVSELPPIAQLEATGRQILAGQGVTIFNVNYYRQQAGEWRGAKENLHALDGEQQILSAAVFQPSWSQTSTSAVPSQYRFRVQSEYVTPEGEAGTIWQSYNVGAPLTSLNDLLELVENTSELPSYLAALGAGPTSEIVDYELEQL